MALLVFLMMWLKSVCIFRYKGESVINAPPSTVFYYVDPLPDGPRAKWDSNMKKIEVLEWLEKVPIALNNQSPLSISGSLRLISFCN